MKKTLTGRLSAGVATIAAVLVVAVPSQAALTRAGSRRTG